MLAHELVVFPCSKDQQVKKRCAGHKGRLIQDVKVEVPHLLVGVLGPNKYERHSMPGSAARAELSNSATSICLRAKLTLPPSHITLLIWARKHRPLLSEQRR